MSDKKCMKWFFSFQKERKWLEEMSLQGYFLKNLTGGVIYTFEKGEPCRMLYDIDRFPMSVKPNLEEINRKEVFFDMAQDMGWKEVTHDETQTYYFTKKWEEDGVNELNNDRESREYRAKKYEKLMNSNTGLLIGLMIFVVIVNLLLQLEYTLLVPTEMDAFAQGYNYFTLGYTLCVCIAILLQKKYGRFLRKELLMSREEWEQSIDPQLHKKVHRLVFTNRGLDKFLTKQQAQGWVLKEVTPMTYTFEKKENGHFVYTMDSRYLVKKRFASDKTAFQDKKDWTGINNDWQIQSVKDAKAKGWEFVCALENRSIIYRGVADAVEPLNDEKYSHRLRLVSIVGRIGVLICVCFLLGFITGFFMTMF